MAKTRMRARNNGAALDEAVHLIGCFRSHRSMARFRQMLRRCDVTVVERTYQLADLLGAICLDEIAVRRVQRQATIIRSLEKTCEPHDVMASRRKH